MEHPEQYFDEKWVHTQGRLSDWPPVAEEEPKPVSQYVVAPILQKSKTNSQAGIALD